ncbi:uncharacterized protein LOC129966746 [Argiope bruennichi]|uniref:uncharacterized protein LOC129966746 n=1 Tax=Argiope bruennichi TaxID=94029 RepID=UPI00249470AD|nr:uncharacterized protein LOC129966746 [Argiope bruennichi]
MLTKTKPRHVLSAVCFLVTFFLQTSSQHFSAEKCQLPSQHVTIERNAEVVIGAILPVHDPGEGLYGCGGPTHDGVQVFEAMRWAVDVLNRKSGLISDGGGGSLIPGVKMGLKVYDSCGHSALAVEHLTALFPVLRSGPRSCDYISKNSTLTIGVVDMSESSHQPGVSESMRDYLIPSIELSLTTLIPPERMAQVLHTATKDLHWTSVTVIHEEEEYSISVTKQMTQAAAAGGATCINSLLSLPKMDKGLRMNHRDLRHYRKVFRTATAGLAEGSAIIVITKNDGTVARFLQVMAEFPEVSKKIQWLFSWIPPPSQMSSLGSHLIRDTRIYSVAPYPDRVLQFEEYWSHLLQTASFSNPEDRWFLEYFMAVKGCKIPGVVDPKYMKLPQCNDRVLNESPMDTLLRTSRAVPALTSVFTLATAFHKAWESKCDSRPGVCPELRAMVRKEFVAQFLEPVEFLVGKSSDEEVDTSSRRYPRHADDRKLEGSKLSLTHYLFEENRGVYFKQIFVYESLGSRLINDDFMTIPSTCSSAGCRGCVRPRQSRLDDRLQDLDSSESLALDMRQADIVIPLLLPIHEAGLSPLECGPVINPEAVQNLEAALWTVDKINEDRASLGGATLGLVAIDTCSSSVLATQKLATYVTNSHLDLASGLAIVSSASAEETLAASAVLRAINISIVSSLDLTPYLGSETRLGLDNHLFQVAAPIESRILAAMDVFDNIGWRYVTVIHEDTPASTLGLQAFLSAAKQRGVCVGHQFELQNMDSTTSQVDRMMQHVIEAKSQGSSVVVLLTSEDTTMKILTSLGKFLEASAVEPGDLVLVGLGEWGEKLDIFRGLEKEALGSVVFKQETGEVSEFSAHFQHLYPGSSPRNPWFDELWHQKEMDEQMMNVNKSSNDPVVEYRALQSTTNTIQAIVAVAAGIATLRSELCQLDNGLCPAMAQHPQLQHLLSHHISSGMSPRLDHPGQTFHFKENGVGDTTIEVYNYRKVNGKTVNYLKVGSYAGQYNRLADMVTYTPAGEIPLESVSSICIQDCYKCQYTSTNHFTIPSSQGLYIAVALGIHEPTANPLTCGPLRPNWGFQNFESLLWAVDTINSDPTILRGIDLGLIVFDTCNSKEKAAMDVSNFLTGTFSDKDTLPSPENVAGFLVDGTRDVLHPVVDLTMPLGMTTVASSVMAPEFGDTKKYSHLLRMNMPSDVIIASFINVLRYFHWKYVSVVYMDTSENSLLGSQGYEELKRQVELHDIEIAVEEKVGVEENIAATMDIVVHRLKIKQNAGARTVILLLPPHYINHLLSAVKRLQHLGRSRLGDFVWLAYDAVEPFQMFPDQSYSALVLRAQSGEIPAFKDYFTKLDVKNNRRNPWFREYWEDVFNCRGSSCVSNHHQNFQQVGFIQDRTVPNTVNGLFTLAFGLDTLQKQLCGEERGWCPAAMNKLLIREKLFEQAKKIRFAGLDGTPIMFGDQNYVSGTLDLYHFREVGDVRAFVNVGLIDEAHGLSINSSLTRGYSDQGKLVSLVDVVSVCNDTDTCSKRSESSALSLPFMKIPANQEFVIGVMMPVHQPGDNFFTCSRVVEESSFQNLLALSYALEKVNRNDTVLPQIKLGALVFDHCGRRQKAEEQIFSFIASDGSLPYSEANLKSRAMVAALTFDPSVADDLSPLFESALIPQIATPSGLATTTTPDRLKRSSRSIEQPQERPEIKVIVDVLKRLDWKFVNLLHSGSESDRSIFWNFIEASKEQKVCISKSLVIRPSMSVQELSALFSEEFRPVHEARVIVLLLEEPTLMEVVLEAAKEAGMIEDYIWIGIESDKDGRNIARLLQGFDIDFFLIRPETYDVPGFREYYSNFNLNKHDPIPDIWFEEFWQHHFRCHLPQSISPLKKLFPEPCSGMESLISHPLNQDTFVYHTVIAVTGVAESLHDYLRRYCVHGDAATNLEDCGGDARQILWREMRKFMKGPPISCVDGDCGPLKMSVGYQIFQLRKAKIHHVYQQIGLWKDKELSMRIEDIEFVTGAKLDSNCHQQCQKCLDQLAIDPEELNLTKPTLYANFRTMWGVIVSALSLLGVLLVIICAAYFLISFQVTVGTTVLGYMILFGLLLLYAVNFAFILSPTEGTCGVRRFGLGLAYAIIFSGMLVKVMNIWRMMGYRGNQFFGDSYHMTSPAALLVVAVGLVIIQVILSSAWLILNPPTTGIHAGEWRCHPATTFEDELIISLVYVMLMLAITILFSVLTWGSKDNNRESRWIFTCCFLITLVWIAWTVVSTQVLHSYRDLTISTANLVCASVVMLCMYLRKVYIYNKLTKDEEKKAKIQQTVSLPAVPNMYGTLTRPVVPPSVFNTGPRLPMGAKMLDRAAPSRMALITSEDGNTSDSGSGSVQVQATDLYPLDMYDGGSQFQPPSLRLGGSSLVLDETTQNQSTN